MAIHALPYTAGDGMREDVKESRTDIPAMAPVTYWDRGADPEGEPVSTSTGCIRGRRSREQDSDFSGRHVEASRMNRPLLDSCTEHGQEPASNRRSGGGT